MKFENAFDVAAPADEVWQALMNVERVAPCMPGAEVLEQTGQDSYKVGIKIKLGPISMLYRGEVTIVERDDSGRQATMSAKAKEARGQGTAQASVHMSLAEQPGATHATIATDMQLSGKAAAMGQGVINDVAQRLVEEFASNLATMLEGPVNGASAPESAAGSAPGSAAGSAPEGATGAPRPEAPTPAPAGADSLPIGRIAAGVIGQRLRDPRLIAIAVIAFVFAVIRSSRRRSE